MTIKKYILDYTKRNYLQLSLVFMIFLTIVGFIGMFKWGELATFIYPIGMLIWVIYTFYKTFIKGDL